MNIMIARKYREFNESLLSGLSSHNNEKHKYALFDFRTAVEAFMKIFILEEFGEDIGQGMLKGILDLDGNEPGTGENMSYSDMLWLMNQRALADNDTRSAINRLKRTHPAAHNPNEPIDYLALSSASVADIRLLSRFLSGKFAQAESAELLAAFDGDGVAGSGAGLLDDPWAAVCQMTENFDRTNRYILVSPPQSSGDGNAWLAPLARIDWSVVLDFDPSTKINGLQSCYDNLDNRSIVNLTLKNRGQRNMVGNGGPGSTNWIFANGISTIPDIISRNKAGWRTLQYHRFIQDTMKEFFSREVHPYVFIYLWDDLSHIEELIRIWDNVGLPIDLSKHIFFTTSDQATEKFLNYSELGLNILVAQMSAQAFVGKLQEFLEQPKTDEQRFLVPGRTREKEKDTIDVTDIFHRLADDGINVIYQSIYLEKPFDDANKMPAFLKGEDINWHELAVGTDIKRNRYQEFSSSMRSLLGSTKRSRRYDLVHKPGAGGTVLAHRVAFDFRTQFPVVMISKSSTRTFQSLSTFLDKVNQTVLAIVEASVIDQVTLDELIRECNSKKLNVIFLYIRRSLQIDRTKDFTFFLNDSMADKLEMDQFVNLVRLFGPEGAAASLVQGNKQPAEFEVIDFTLSINQEEFNSERLGQYVNSYIEQMPESQVTFLVYVCFVYHYSQKGLSHHVFRSLFKGSLLSELKHMPTEKRYLRKMLVQQFDLQRQEPSEYWRPRFAKFAEVVLSQVLGQGKMSQWKDHINAYAKKFIEDIRASNEYLVGETRDILKSVFFDRGDDLPEQGEQSGNGHEKFSRLMADIGVKELQLEVLNALLDAYPDESHFQGQLGRFIFEKAEEWGEFREAESLISDALDTTDGRTDYNLHHIAGMCKSKEIKFLLKHFRRYGASLITESRLKELAEIGSGHFSDSVRINNYNVHGYVAHLQMLMEVIDYGRELSGIDNRWNFLNAPDKRWYMEQYSEIQRLIEMTKSLVENEYSLGLSNRLFKTRQHIRSGEARALELLGNFHGSLEVYKSMIDTVERGYRPHMRILVIYAILMAKVHGNKRKIDEAWGKLKSEEALTIKKMLNDNVMQDSSHLLSFKLWFKLVRFSNVDTTRDELIARLREWYKNAEESRVLRAEAAFYLYVLYAIELIDAGDSFSPNLRADCEYYMEQSRNNSFNKKYVFEHLGYGQGLDGLINHWGAKEADEDVFQRVEGVVSSINARQEGTINLKCGLEVFFVPKEGNYTQMKDETSDVTFRVGFRPEGLVAFDVKRVPKNQEKTAAPISEQEESDEPEIVEPIEPELLQEEKKEDPQLFRANFVKLEQPKIITKIVLDERNTRKPKKK